MKYKFKIDEIIKIKDITDNVWMKNPFEGVTGKIIDISTFFICNPPKYLLWYADLRNKGWWEETLLIKANTKEIKEFKKREEINKQREIENEI